MDLLCRFIDLYPNNEFSIDSASLSVLQTGTYSKVDGSGGSNGARMRFDPEASWGANAGLDIPRKALENVKVRDEREER